MKTLELNQMERVNGGADCEGQVTASLLASAALISAAVIAGPFGLALASASFLVSWNNLGNCIDGH